MNKILKSKKKLKILTPIKVTSYKSRRIPGLEFFYPVKGSCTQMSRGVTKSLFDDCNRNCYVFVGFRPPSLQLKV